MSKELTWKLLDLSDPIYEGMSSEDVINHIANYSELRNNLDNLLVIADWDGHIVNYWDASAIDWELNGGPSSDDWL